MRIATLFQTVICYALLVPGCGGNGLGNASDAEKDRDLGATAVADAANLDTRMTCDELAQAAGDSWVATLASAQKDYPCQSSDDCVTVGVGVLCDPACSAYVTTGAAQVIAEGNAALEKGLCAQYAAKGCPAALIPPCIVYESPNTCVDGMCLYRP